MGFRVGSVCYETEWGAADAYVATMSPVRTVSPDGELIEWALVFDDEFQWPRWMWQKSIDGTPVYSTFTDPPSMTICYPEDSVIDGAILGWAVGGCLIAAFVFRMFKRAAL